MKKNVLLIANPNSVPKVYNEVKSVYVRELGGMQKVLDFKSIRWLACIGNVVFDAEFHKEDDVWTITQGPIKGFIPMKNFPDPRVVTIFTRNEHSEMCLDCGIRRARNSGTYHVVENPSEYNFYIPAEELYSYSVKVKIRNHVRDAWPMCKHLSDSEIYSRLKEKYVEAFKKRNIHFTYPMIRAAVILGRNRLDQETITITSNLRRPAVKVFKDVEFQYLPERGEIRGDNDQIRVSLNYGPSSPAVKDILSI